MEQLISGSFIANHEDQEEEEEEATFMAQLLFNTKANSPPDPFMATLSYDQTPSSSTFNYSLSRESSDELLFPNNNHYYYCNPMNNNNCNNNNSNSSNNYFSLGELGNYYSNNNGSNFHVQVPDDSMNVEVSENNLQPCFEEAELIKLPEEEAAHYQIDQINCKKRSRGEFGDHAQKGRNEKPKKTQKLTSSTNTTEEDGNAGPSRQSTSTYCSEDESNASLDRNGGANNSGSSLNGPNKSRASRGSATDPQSLYARKRRERINERLRILQNLVPNGTKVDISTMLEEAVQYVKFLQLQIKLLSSDDLWMYAPIAYNGMDIGLNPTTPKTAKEKES